MARTLIAFDWPPIRYRNVISVLRNPFYAGAYAYGKSEKRTELVDGHVRKSYGHGKLLEQCEVLLKDHHEGYIEWAEFDRNQTLLAANAFGRAGGVKSGRGGRALLAGLLACGRCGRRLPVVYAGKTPRPTYRCDRPNLMLGLKRCLGFGGARVEAAVARELIRAVEPMAIEAALEAERMHMESHNERRRIVELELQQAQYEARLAERRYAACDPDNRLTAAQLEKSWEAALRRVEACQARLDAEQRPDQTADAPDFTDLAADLSAAWDAPTTTMRARQRLVRALIKDIIADVDEATREVVLVIHWKGGQHSQLRVKKPKTGEHGCSTSEDALAVMRSMAGRWDDAHVAASLNGWVCERARENRGMRSGSVTSDGSTTSTPTFRREEWRVVDDAGGRQGIGRHFSRHPAPDPKPGSRRRTSRARRTVPNQSVRSARGMRRRRHPAKGRPVSRRCAN